MYFPISHREISALYLVGVGFAVGILGGFLGVGGSFLAGPALFAAGVPMNVVIGTDLAHIVGKSIVATKKHRALGNVDTKLGLLMVIGTVAGVEIGAQSIEYLKRRAHVDVVVGAVYVVILLSISIFIGWESLQTIRNRRASRGEGAHGVKDLKPGQDENAFSHISARVRRIYLPPMISLPESGISSISLWAVVGVAVVGGFFSGFLGGGAGYIRMPALVYVLGVPTHVAVGTDLFEVMISASYGTLTHGLKGNVDIMIALVMHTGAAIGAQIGATITRYFVGPRLRLAFVPLPILGAVLVVYGLLSGTHMG